MDDKKNNKKTTETETRTRNETNEPKYIMKRNISDYFTKEHASLLYKLLSNTRTQHNPTQLPVVYEEDAF